MLTKLQLKEIEEIIKRRFLTFSYDALGRRALTLDELEMLRRAGLLKPSVASFTGDAFTLGKIVAAIDRVRAKELGLFDFIKLAERRPITSVEQHAINWASDHTAQYIRGISDSMVKDIGAATARATGAAVRAIQDEVKDTILNRNTVSELQTALFGAIDDKARDWRRVAATEMNNAIQNGVYSAIREERGSHQLVFKRPSPDACVHCKRVYLHTNGMPIVFKMHELTDTNFGAKAREWTATIGSVHPNCQCQLQMLPDGYGFEKQMTVSTPFESGGKGYGRGRIVSTDEYAALNAEEKSKIGYDWIMTYGGLTESLEKSSDSIYHSELDECICSY